MTNYGDSPIDAKRMPGTIFIGVIIMVLGMILFFYAVYSLVMWGLEKDSPFGLAGSIIVIILSSGVIAVGSILMFAGTLNRLFGRRNRRLLY
jgi:hypothetical protein